MADSTEPTSSLPTHIWSKAHVYSVPLVENIKIGLGDVEAVFHVYCRLKSDKDGHYLLLSVTTEEPVDYGVIYGYFLPGKDRSKLKWENSMLTRTKSTSSPNYWKVEHPASHPLVLELVFKVIQYRQLYPLPEVGLKKYIERGPDVLLVGSDGSVTVPRRALEIRSETFENMFKYDSKERQTGKIELKDLDYRTLDAFSHFLATGRIKDGKGTALPG